MNLQAGGYNGSPSDETKKKLSEVNKKRVQEASKEYLEKMLAHMQELGRKKRGTKTSEQTKQKMSQARLDNPRPEKWLKSITESNKNRIWTEESKSKLRESTLRNLEHLDILRKRNREKIWTEEDREKARLIHLGKKHTAEHNKKIGDSVRGEKNPNYGKPIHENSKEALKKANTGRVKTLEEIEKTAAKNRGKKRTQESKDKISKANIGKKRTQEHKESYRKAKLGKKLSDEHKENISKSLNENVFTKDVREKMRNKKLGTKKSESTKEKMSIAAKGKKKSPEAIQNRVNSRARNKALKQSQLLSISNRFHILNNWNSISNQLSNLQTNL